MVKRQRKSRSDGLTPKQRQMMVSVDEMREWDKKSTAVKKAPGHGSLLPVKTVKGKWKNSQAPTVEEAKEEVLEAETKKRKITQKTTAGKSVEEVRVEMANIALILSESPESNMKKLGELRSFCELSRHKGREDAESTKELVQVAMLTTLAAMKDLMPGYMVRALGEDELAGSGPNMVSKEVRAVRAFEQSFLGHYKAFLQRLAKGMVDEDASIKFVAFACLSELLQCASHFNRYEDVVKWCVSGCLSSKSAINEACAEAIEATLKNDEYGKSTYLLTRALSDAIKDRDYRAPVRAIACLRSAQIRTDIAGHLPNAQIVKAPRLKKTLSKRDKKAHKQKMAELQKVSDAEALVSKEEQEQWHSDALRYVFRVYFGLLKKHPEDSAGMAEVLKGLATFAHLLSQEEDYFADLLRSLKSVLIAEKCALSVEASLQAVLTVGRIQALQQKILSIDVKFIYNHLFALLERLQHKGTKPSSEALTLLRQVLKDLLGPRLALPAVRLAAYAQRLADTALHHCTAGSEHESHVLLSILHDYLADHRNVRMALLDRECAGQGSYLPKVPDPDLCCPYARSICVPLDAIARTASPRIHNMLGRIYALASRNDSR